MDRDELKKQLVLWHNNDEHPQIIDTIEKLPRKEWDFEISGLYARALNNLDRYKEALTQLFIFQEEGRENGVWNFRVGYSLYFLNREAEAAEYFQKAIDYGDDVEDTREMLGRSIIEATMKALLMDGVKLLEAGERNTEKIQEKFAGIMTGINNCRNKHFGNDADMKEIVKNMTAERVTDIAEYFDLDIDIEKLIEKLEV